MTKECYQCGKPIPASRKKSDYCSVRCERLQHEQDERSAQVERDIQEGFYGLGDIL